MGCGTCRRSAPPRWKWMKRTMIQTHGWARQRNARDDPKGGCKQVWVVVVGAFFKVKFPMGFISLALMSCPDFNPRTRNGAHRLVSWMSATHGLSLEMKFSTRFSFYAQQSSGGFVCIMNKCLPSIWHASTREAQESGWVRACVLAHAGPRQVRDAHLWRWTCLRRAPWPGGHSAGLTICSRHACSAGH
jgi:hypothetical protein